MKKTIKRSLPTQRTSIPGMWKCGKNKETKEPQIIFCGSLVCLFFEQIEMRKKDQNGV